MKKIIFFILCVMQTIHIIQAAEFPEEYHHYFQIRRYFYHYIPWPFTTYSEPDFLSARTGTFGPQSVRITEKKDNGWAMTVTDTGTYWVYILDDLPNPDVSVLDDFLRKWGNAVSIYYKNLEFGFIYTHNAERVFSAASVIKAPYALYIYHLAEKGLADLNTVHTYTIRDYRGGSGVIRHMRPGMRFTEYELLKHAIRYSDNVAFHMLIRAYGIYGFREFVTEIGGDSGLIRTVAGASMTAAEAGLFALEIYRYIESDGKYAAQFKADLKNTNNPMIVSDWPMARKYGWWQGNFHDMAIVYSDSPYILVIMTQSGGNFRKFREISMVFQEFNDTNFRR